MKYELDDQGYFLCDLPDGSDAEHWTIDPIPQPIGLPRYVGATYNPPSGEWTGGIWVDEAEPDQPAVPAAVSMRQARLALLNAGLLHHVDAAIDLLPEPDRTAAQIEWEYAQEVRRASPTAALVGAALELDEAQVDNLFMQAATL